MEQLRLLRRSRLCGSLFFRCCCDRFGNRSKSRCSLWRSNWSGGDPHTTIAALTIVTSLVYMLWLGWNGTRWLIFLKKIFTMWTSLPQILQSVLATKLPWTAAASTKQTFMSTPEFYNMDELASNTTKRPRNKVAMDSSSTKQTFMITPESDWMPFHVTKWKTGRQIFDERTQRLWEVSKGIEKVSTEVTRRLFWRTFYNSKIPNIVDLSPVWWRKSFFAKQRGHESVFGSITNR